MKENNLKVLMISGVSQATHIPVQKPKPEERRRKKMYFEQAVSKNACLKGLSNYFIFIKFDKNEIV